MSNPTAAVSARITLHDPDLGRIIADEIAGGHYKLRIAATGQLVGEVERSAAGTYVVSGKRFGHVRPALYFAVSNYKERR
jgi:hypothetical protein